jgi:hypothetical protein
MSDGLILYPTLHRENHRLKNEYSGLKNDFIGKKL